MKAVLVKCNNCEHTEWQRLPIDIGQDSFCNYCEEYCSKIIVDVRLTNN